MSAASAPTPTDNSSALIVTPGVSSSVIVSVTPVAERLPAVALRTRLSSSSLTLSLTIVTSVEAEFPFPGIVTCPGEMV